MTLPVSYAEMLRVQLRKRHRIAPVLNLEFEPRTGNYLAPDLIAMVTADDARTYLFRSECVELPNGIKIPYKSVSGCHWIAKTQDSRKKAAMKLEHYGTLILDTGLGDSHELTGLNQAVFPLMKFFRWCLQKGTAG